MQLLLMVIPYVLKIFASKQNIGHQGRTQCQLH